MEATPQLVTITNLDSLVAQQMFDIYEYSFPKEQREPINHLRDELSASASKARSGKSGQYALGGLVDGELVVFSIFYYDVAHKLSFLSYFAVSQDSKGQGYGSWMFQELLQYLKKTPFKNAKGLCWEVERPQEANISEIRIIRKKRIAFYEKNGAILLSKIDYIAPPITKKLSSIKYHLMYMSLWEEPGDLSFQSQKSILEFIFFEVYGVKANNPYYQQSLTSLQSFYS